MGSASLFFRIQPSNAILADVNPHLVETFCEVRDRPDDVYNELVKFPRTKAEYEQRRATEFSKRSGIDLAATFIYLNRNCFNGLYRINKKDLFNVPFSGDRTGNYPTLDEFRTMSIVLRTADLRCGDFCDVVSSTVNPGDFVYLDPPFAIVDKRGFYEYSYKYFGPKDLPRLDELLSYVDSAGARFMLSYADNDIIKTIAAKWHTNTVSINRNISGFLSSRRKSTELIVTNFQSSEIC